MLPPAPIRASSTESSTAPLPVSDDASLLAAYQLQGAQLFQGAAAGATAYVTLEPCSHAQGSPVDGSTCNGSDNDSESSSARTGISSTTTVTTAEVAGVPGDEGAAVSTTSSTTTTTVVKKKKATPPCAGALVASGVTRVVIGCRDPNPRVDGGGVATLEAAGIEVDGKRDLACLSCERACKGKEI